MNTNSLSEAVKKYGNVSAAARALGIPRSTFDRRLAKEKRGEPIEIAPKQKKAQRGLTEEELLLKHSSEHQVMYAAKKIEKGVFIPEAEFIHSLHLTGGYKHIVEREEFKPFRGRASGGFHYWGHPERIKAMKNDGVLT